MGGGGENRIRAARFPARKTIEDFDFDHQRSLKRDVIAHLGTLDFVEAKENGVFLGPPGTGTTHLATGPDQRTDLARGACLTTSTVTTLPRIGHIGLLSCDPRSQSDATDRGPRSGHELRRKAVTSQKNGVSALGLQRVLGLGSYRTAWTWMHKLRRAMVRPAQHRRAGVRFDRLG